MSKQGIFRIFSNINHYNFLNNTRVPVVCQTAGLKRETQKTIAELNIPEKPKRPLSAFMRFLKEKRPGLLSEKPNLTPTEVAKIGSQQWKALDDSARNKYVTDYKNELEGYTKQFTAYKTKLTDEQAHWLKLKEFEKSNAKRRRKLKKELTELGKPKRPLTSYLLFSLEYSKSKNSSPIKLYKEIKQEWESLPEAKKQQYQTQYEANKSQYESDMKTWEAKMLEKGKTDLVRAAAFKPEAPSRLRKTKAAVEPSEK